MPTSGTGIYRSRAARRADAGFSLLELLVVVAIIGLLVQAVTLSIGALGNDRQLEEESKRLRSVIDLLHEESLMQSRDYGVMFTATGYRFYVYDYQQLEWVVPQADRLLTEHALYPQLSMALVLDGRDVPLDPSFEAQDVDNPEPQVMVLASGEMTPFTLEMARDGMDGRFELRAELNGELTLAEKGYER
jgi:general secretion pathway protein H